jgi:NAD(P)-dependent dehydrogenase (short-subunit alcohol dehydrogenase family)
MARVFITGSAGGLGRGAAEALLADGHEVVVHGRDAGRAASLDELVARGARVVAGDLADRDGTAAVAGQVNAIGGIDAVIHNAAVYGDRETLQVNVLAPYLLTAWVRGPRRLVYLSSDMHRSGDASLDGWSARRWRGTQAYCDSKLCVTALVFALGRRWPDRRVHAVDPGWVPTRMGGSNAPDDLELGHRTQVWLAVTDDPATTDSGYWFHQQRRTPAAAALDPTFQDALLHELERLTGVPLP